MIKKSINSLFKKSFFFWWVKRRLRKYGIPQEYNSQYGQDSFVFELLNYPEKGFFIDIGANDGVTISNTKYFEDIGWKGICIEPNPAIYKNLKLSRRCICINTCISNRDTSVNFLIVHGKGHMLSGIKDFMDENHLRRIDDHVNRYEDKKELIKIDSLQLSTILEKYNIKSIDYLSIDTEGCEFEILNSIDFVKIPINVLSVENGSGKSKIFKLLSQNNFRLIKCLGCDEIYQKININSY